MRLRQLLLMCALFSPMLAGAQQATGRIVGRVAGDAGQPIPAVSVVVLGTNPARGAQTDAAGRYVIAGVPVGTHSVQARSIGYRANSQAVRVAASDSVVANFQLTAQATQLSAVVTVGYGTQSRRNVTGAVASLNNEDIRQVVAAIRSTLSRDESPASTSPPGASSPAPTTASGSAARARSRRATTRSTSSTACRSPATCATSTRRASSASTCSRTPRRPRSTAAAAPTASS